MPKHKRLESFEMPSEMALGLQPSPMQVPSVSQGISLDGGHLPFEKQIKHYEITTM